MHGSIFGASIGGILYLKDLIVAFIWCLYVVDPLQPSAEKKVSPPAQTPSLGSRFGMCLHLVVCFGSAGLATMTKGHGFCL
jgi:hypothetical protein